MATTASGAAATTNPHNVYSFPKVNNNQLEPNDNNNNNNHHARARAHEWQRILDAYEDVMGRPMPRFVESEICSFLHGGAETGMVRAVIEYTACAPRPSWAYARTVLHRNLERGICTEVDFVVSLSKRGRAGDEDVPF